MRLALLCIGGHKESWLADIGAEYERKIGALVPFEIIRLKPVKLERSSRDAKQVAESQQLLRALGKDDLVVICDERGQSFDSATFSKRLVKAFERGRPRVVFVVGGAFGFTDELRQRADWIWSLSPLVFNHLVAQTVVLEQLYRGLAIWKNLPYHNE